MRTDGLSFYALTKAGTFASEFTNGVQRAQQEHLEGPYRFEWEFTVGEQGVTDDMIDEWFKTRLTLPIEVHENGVRCWRGFVYEMEHYRKGIFRKKTCDGLANTVKVEFNDEFDDRNIIKYSEWYKNQESIDLYGPWEGMVKHEGGNSWVYDPERNGPAIDPETGKGVTEIDERAAVELYYRSDPYTVGGISVVDHDPDKKSSLHVVCVGAIVLAQNVTLSNGRLPNQLTADGDPIDPYRGLRYTGKAKWNDYYHGDEITVGDEVARIVDVVQAAGRPLYPLYIAANDIPTAAGVGQPMGAYKRLVELAKLRNSKGQFYRLRVEDDGGVIYDIVPDKPAPDYLFYASSDKPRVLMVDGRTIPKWSARPGYVRIIDDQSDIGMPRTWLADANVQFKERTTMREGDESASLEKREFDIADIYSIEAANLRWAEEERPENE